MAHLLFPVDYAHSTSCHVGDRRFSQIVCQKITPGLCGWKNALYWNIATLGKVRAYVVYDGKNCVHFSYVVKGREKFTFLKSGDIEIGPCWTHPDYRGLGLYPAVLSQIVQNEISSGGTAYMVICESNQASQRGVAKVGFRTDGTFVFTNFWKQYHINQK